MKRPQINDVFVLLSTREKDVKIRTTDIDRFNSEFIGNRMSPTWSISDVIVDTPDGRLADFIAWTFEVPVVSETVKSLFEELYPEHVQLFYLTTIRGIRYYAVNVVSLVECIDLPMSDVRYSRRDRTLVDYIDRIVFAEGFNPTEHPIFKDPRYPDRVFVNSAFATEVISRKLSGARFLDPGASLAAVITGVRRWDRSGYFLQPK